MDVFPTMGLEGDMDIMGFGGGGAPVRPGENEALAIVSEYTPQNGSARDIIDHPIRRCWEDGSLSEKIFDWVNGDTPIRIAPATRMEWREENYLPYQVFVTYPKDIGVMSEREVEIAMTHLEHIARDTLAREYLHSRQSKEYAEFLKALFYDLWNFETGEEHHLLMLNTLCRWD